MRIFAARFLGGFLIAPLSMPEMVDGDRIAALAICLVVDPAFLFADIAFRVLAPVPLPATPFFGAFLGCFMFLAFVVSELSL